MSMKHDMNPTPYEQGYDKGYAEGKRDAVKHGRWEITDAYPHWMCCSVCHKAVVRNIEVIERYEIPTSFCPNCGAKMDA